MVVFATPGMLHGGLSLEIFKKWCTNEKNMIIMPGYCVAGTVGNKILSGMRKIELKPGQVCYTFLFEIICISLEKYLAVVIFTRCLLKMGQGGISHWSSNHATRTLPE